MLRQITIFIVVFLFTLNLIACDWNNGTDQSSEELDTVDDKENTQQLGSLEQLNRLRSLRRSFGVKSRQAEKEERAPRIKRWFRRRRRRSRRRSRQAAAAKYDVKRMGVKKLHVAYYLQHFKLFGYLNAKHIKRVQYSKELWHRDWKYAFPTKPTIRLDTALELICEESAEKCMKAVQNVSIHSTMFRAFWTQLEKGGLLMGLNRPEEFTIYSTIDPFGRVKEEYVYRATAMYYLCWWTMQEAEYLKHMGAKGDKYGPGGCQGFGMKDYRATDKIPWACAQYSFCPDPCCDPGKDWWSMTESMKAPPRQGHTKEFYSFWPQNEYDCQAREGNPCYPIGYGKCQLDRKKNTNLKDLMMNKFNVTCECSKNMPGYKWYNKAQGCVDHNECLDKSKPNICGPHSICRNNQGSYSCECRSHYSQVGGHKKPAAAAKRKKGGHKKPGAAVVPGKGPKKKGGPPKKGGKAKKGKKAPAKKKPPPKKKKKPPRRRWKRPPPKRRRGRKGRRRGKRSPDEDFLTDAEKRNLQLLKKRSVLFQRNHVLSGTAAPEQEVKTRVKRWFIRRRARRKKPLPRPKKIPPPKRPKNYKKPRAKKPPTIHKCVKNVTEDIFNKIMLMLEKGEKQARKVIEKKSGKTEEGKAKKIENAMRYVFNLIRGKSSANVIHPTLLVSLSCSLGALVLGQK